MCPSGNSDHLGRTIGTDYNHIIRKHGNTLVGRKVVSINTNNNNTNNDFNTDTWNNNESKNFPESIHHTWEQLDNEDRAVIKNGLNMSSKEWDYLVHNCVKSIQCRQTDKNPVANKSDKPATSMSGSMVCNS